MKASAGCRSVELFDDQTGLMFPVVVLYPSHSAEQPAPLGPYTLSVAMDAPIAGAMLPLVVISHGTGGSHLAYRDLAAHLARSGFVVALPEHPRNNRNNNELAGTADILTYRPRLIRNTIDWMFSSDVFGPCLKPDTAGMVGHSLGGYTALAVAGGRPTAFPHETPERRLRPIDVRPDGRVKALVLLTPAAAWFLAPGALQGVNVPIQMWTAEKDPHTPAWNGALIENGVADRSLVEHKVVGNAGHFSFLSPFPETMRRPDFPPSQDPEGFDRPRFHEELNAEVAAFLKRVLGAGSTDVASVP